MPPIVAATENPVVLRLAKNPRPPIAPVTPPRPPQRNGWLVLGLLWTFAAGYICLTGINLQRTAQAADRLEALYRASPRNAVGRGLCAGYEATQPPTMYDPDSHCWINLTQRQIAQGTVRPHDFPFDNAPYGRERHWSSSFSWWLLAVGEAASLWRGLPLAQTMTESAAWANPVLFVLFLGALALGLRRQLNVWAVGAFLVTLAALRGVEWDFSYGRPDHHGLHLMAFLGLVLGALTAGLGWVRTDLRDDPEAAAGWQLVRPRPWRQARRWFTASAVCGGIGLWIGSAQQCVCIGTLGMGAVLGGLLFARRANATDACRFEPELWRHWARVGALTSLFFYLLEYFPSHMEVHLEVNHPIIALGWLGAGELMYILLLARVDWPAIRARRGEMCVRAVLGLLAMGALPLAIVFGPRAWFALADPFLARSTHLISEGLPWIDPLTFGGVLRAFWDYTGALMLAVPLTIFVLIRYGRVLPPWRSSGVMALLLTVGMFLAWTLLQNRWMGFLESSLAMLALLVAPCVPLPPAVVRQGGALPLALLALTVPGWAGFGLLQASSAAENPLIHAKAMLGDMMATKEAAWNLRFYAAKLNAHTPARVMAPSGPSPVLHYYGGVDTVESYYWENIDAYHTAVDFFMDEGDAVARRIARERQLDFVMVMMKPSFVLELQWLKLGHTDISAARRTLAFRLSNPTATQPPAWLVPLPLVDAPMAQEQGVRIYRVVRERL